MISVQSSDAEVVAFLLTVKSDAPRDAQLAAELATVLASSGRLFDPKAERTADVASTGGPSSLSTLLCPLFLRAGGLVVPKLGVPGRPAGGIDCLAQLDGYRTAMSEPELHAALLDAGYAHFLAAQAYAPLDARVFSLRQKHGFQEVPTLVAASLLSKKLAVGVKLAGLDVRVAPHGNFGRSWDEALDNAKLFTDSSALLGLVGRPVLTDGTKPYQPYIGRAEALLALAAMFESTDDAWLSEHVELCRQLATAAAPAASRSAIEGASREELKGWFVANLRAQGSNLEAFEALVARTRAQHTLEVRAQRGGRLDMSLEGIRRTLVRYQSSMGSKQGDFPDPLGVILKRKPGDWVESGDLLATVRADVSAAHDNVLSDLGRSISTTN